MGAALAVKVKVGTRNFLRNFCSRLAPKLGLSNEKGKWARALSVPKRSRDSKEVLFLVVLLLHTCEPVELLAVVVVLALSLRVVAAGTGAAGVAGVAGVVGAATASTAGAAGAATVAGVAAATAAACGGGRPFLLAKSFLLLLVYV